MNSKIYLEYTKEESQKFWMIKKEKVKLIITFGKLGTGGQTQTKVFASEEETDKQMKKLVDSKLKKGYQEIKKPKNGNAKLEKNEKLEKVKPPKDVKEDSKEKAWHNEAYYGYYYYPRDEEFFLKESEKKERTVVKKHIDDETFLWDKEGQEEFDWALESQKDKEEEMEDLGEYYNNQISYAAHTFEEFSFAHQEYAKFMRERDVIKVLARRLKKFFYGSSLKDEVEIDIIQYIFEQGIPLTKINSDEIQNTCLKEFYKKYEDNPEPSQVKKIFENYLNEVYSQASVIYIEMIKSVVKKFDDLSYESEYIGDDFPCQFPENCYGFSFYVFSDICILHPILLDHSDERWATTKIEITDGIGDTLAKKYVKKYLTPKLKQLNKEGYFKNLSRVKINFRYEVANEGIHLLDVEGNTNNYESMKNEYEFLEKKVIMDRVEEVTPYELEKVLVELLEGGYLERNLDKAQTIVKRYLYCIEEELFETAEKILEKYYWFSEDLHYELAMSKYKNLRYYRAYEIMCELANSGSEIAKQKEKEWKEEARQRAIDYNTKIISHSKEPIYTETDMYVESDKVAMRADNEGNVYIRFIEESEGSYSETLDFLNNLLIKGYSHNHKGYAVYVRFLAKPKYIKELKSFPRTSCHAFFAKAVMYPNLREKVKTYAELALEMYHWYLDLNDEENTVTGTFAACALALCDEKYIDLAGLYARESDDEHQYIQLMMAPALIKKYGEIPAVARALFDLCISNGQDGRLKITSGFMDPENLNAIMEYIETGIHYQQHMDGYITRYVDHMMGYKVKSNLKKLKSFAEVAQTLEDKNIFIDFYNLYRECASSYNQEDYGEELKIMVEEKEIVVPEYNEEPPLILPTVEAKEKGLLEGLVATKKFEPKYDLRRPVIFSPAAITNPYYYDYVDRNFKAVLKSNSPVGQTYQARLFGEKNEWAFVDMGAVYDLGVILYHGKKPIVLYGMFDVAPLAKRYFKKPFKNAKEAETIRQQFLIEESQKRPQFSKEEKIMENKFAMARHYYDSEYYYAAKVMLDDFKESDSQHFYNASLLLRAKLAHIQLDKNLEVKLYKELLDKLPEYKDYWIGELHRIGVR